MDLFVILEMDFSLEYMKLIIHRLSILMNRLF